MSDNISIGWINEYVDKTLAIASSLPPGPFRDAICSRAEHAMDLVEAWRHRDIKHE
jgi:hypothetical protein